MSSVQADLFRAKIAQRSRPSSSNGERLDLLSLPFHKALAEPEQRLIEKALQDSGADKTEAANRLQINRRLLYNKIEEHKISEEG